MPFRRILILLIIPAMVIPLHAQDSTKVSDFDRYVAEVREQGMTESARDDLATIASIVAGSVILEFRRNETTGEYGRSYQNTTCPLPGADDKEVTRWKAGLRAKSDSITTVYKAIADLDASGFVSTSEGALFRRVIEFALGYNQLVSAVGNDPQSLARALYVSESEIPSLKEEYLVLRKRAMHKGVSGWPSIE